jgi:hypothetical protein
LKLHHWRFLPWPFEFIITNHLTNRRYIMQSTIW